MSPTPLTTPLAASDLQLLSRRDLIGQTEVTFDQAVVNRAIGKGPTEPRPKIAGLLAISDAQLDRMVAEGRFPKPLKVGKRMVRWRVRDVHEWLEGLSQEQVAA